MDIKDAECTEIELDPFICPECGGEGVVFKGYLYEDGEQDWQKCSRCKGSGKLQMCGRCYDFVDEVFPPNCNEKPEDLKGMPLGQYHCRDCGAMVIAGVPHPELCKACLERKNPKFDKVG